MRVVLHNCFEPILWHANLLKVCSIYVIYVDLVNHIRAVGRFKNSGGEGRQVVIQGKVGR